MAVRYRGQDFSLGLAYRFTATVFVVIILFVSAHANQPDSYPVVYSAQNPRTTSSSTTTLRAPLVIVGTIDGGLHALDAATGHQIWSIQTGALLRGQPTDGTAPHYLPNPSTGDLYYVVPGTQTLQPVGKTVQELVAQSPFKGEDGNVYLGQKKSSIFAVHADTGELSREYTSLYPSQGHNMEDGSTLYIARTEYTVTVHTTGSIDVPYNLTFAEFTSAEVEDRQSTSNGNFSTRLGTHMLSYTDNRANIFWEADLEATVVATYLPSLDGSLLRTRLKQMAPVHSLQTDQDGEEPVLGYDDDENESKVVDEDETYYSLVSVDVCNGIHYATTSVAFGSSTTVGRLAHQRLAQLTDLSEGPTTTALSIVGAGVACDSEDPMECMRGIHVMPCLPEEVPQPDTPDFPTDTFPEIGYELLVVIGMVAVVFVALQVYFVRTLLYAKKPQTETPSTAPPLEADTSGDSSEDSVETLAREQGVPDLLPNSSDDEAVVNVGARKKRRRRKASGGSLSSPSSSASASADRETPLADAVEKSVASATNLSSVVGKLNLSPEILGHGSHGTIIFKGTYEGREIAVKRLLREYFDVASREVDLLRKSDDHPNVVRYFCMEQDTQFFYIGLELCLATLVQVVEGPSISTRGTRHGRYLDMEAVSKLDRKHLAHDLLSGLSHLHSLNIVHRDVKPNNVLISKKSGKFRAMISDFGLCAALKDNQSSFNTTQVGTIGWVAPEVLRNERTTKSVDIFSAGCVVHYLVHSVHPYGQYFEREVNIRNAKRKITKADPITDDLVLQMLKEDPDLRPTACATLFHPYFWTPAKRLQFLNDVSDRIEKEPTDSPLIALLERHAVHIVTPDWRNRLDEDVLTDMCKRRKYRWNSVMDLMRAIRNKKHHYQELPKHVKKLMGALPNGFYSYFEDRFPRLLLHAYQMVSESTCRQERLFREYFEALDQRKV